MNIKSPEKKTSCDFILRKFIRDTSPHSNSPGKNSKNLQRGNSQSRIFNQNSFNISKNTINNFTEVFEYFDSTKNGYLLPADLRNMFDSLGLNLERAEIFQILCDFDQNEKGFIDFNDFVKIMTDKLTFFKLSNIQNEKLIFQDFSLNGFITEESLHKAYGQKGFLLSKDVIKGIFEVMRENGEFEKEENDQGIDFKHFQKSILRAHQKLGNILKEDLAKI